MGTTVFPKPLDQDVSGKQNKNDNSLETTSKTVVGAINEVNGKFSADPLSVSSIDTLKSALLAKANGMAQYETKFVTFWVSGATTGFSTGKNYSGTITISSKTSNSLYFDVVLSAYNGDIVIVGYANGTWNINSLNGKISAFVQVGQYVFTSGEIGSKPSASIAISDWTNSGTYVIRVDDYYDNYNHYIDEIVVSAGLFTGTARKRHTICGARYLNAWCGFIRDGNNLSFELPEISNAKITSQFTITITVFKRI